MSSGCRRLTTPWLVVMGWPDASDLAVSIALLLADTLASLSVLADAVGEGLETVVPRGGATALSRPKSCAFVALWGIAAARACAAARCTVCGGFLALACLRAWPWVWASWGTS